MMQGSSRSRSDIPQARAVFVYVCDSLRRDHLSCYGYGRNTTPHLDELAHDSIVFDNAFSECTWTRPSAASLLTSLYPPAHGTVTRLDGLSRRLTTLPGVLKGCGFATVCISTMANVSKLCGFDNGFDTFIELYKDRNVLACRGVGEEHAMFRLIGEKGPTADARSEDINECLFESIEGAGQGSAPFVFIWSIDTHDPYDPPQRDRLFLPPSRRATARATNKDIQNAKTPAQLRELIDLYDCEIHSNDRTIGELIGWLKKRGMYDSTLLVLTADHGEAFGEHGETGHCRMPYEERISIPLILKLPGQCRGGSRCSHLAQLMDIAPTVLRSLGREAPDQWQGHDLLHMPRGRRSRRREAYSHCRFTDEGKEYASVRTTRHKYTRIPQIALFSVTMKL